MKYIKYALIGITAFITIIIGYTIAKNVIYGVIIEIPGIDLTRTLPDNAPKVLDMNKDMFEDLISNSFKDLFIIQAWSLTSTCDSDIDTNMIFSIERNFPNVEFIIVSYDPYFQNVKKAIQLDLYDKGFLKNVYILDNNFIISYLIQNRSEGGLLDFLNSIIGSEHKEITAYQNLLVFNKRKQFIYNTSYIDSKKIEELLKNMSLVN